jgi:U3 small nucleolar RNA-associated protein 14
LQKNPRREENGSDDEDESDDAIEDSDDSEDSDEDHVFSASDAENSPAALEELGKFISNLEPSAKRKVPLDEDSNTQNGVRPKKRRMIEERTEAGEENEFHAQAFGKSPVIYCGTSLTLYSLQMLT